MSNTFNASETLRQMALTKRELSWMGGIAETVARLEEDNDRMSRDIEAYKGAGERYEQEIARKDAAIADQARQLKEALAALEKVKRGAGRGESRHCNDCENKVCTYMPGLGQRVRFNCPLWAAKGENKRGPCAENGGTEDTTPAPHTTMYSIEQEEASTNEN